MVQSHHTPPDADEEDRLMLERADQAWHRQIESEEAATAAPSRYGAMFRWIILGIAGIALIMLLFTRLGQLT